jgi:hypothetical protein
MTGVKIAYYKKEDWSRLLLIIDDKESMHDSWNEWFTAYSKAKTDLISQGFMVVDVEIDLDELIRYCKLRRVKNNGKARSQFVQEK